ncbi:MAG TPA: hypothetical protein VM182_16980 [Terriglobia bacterium]|nr:hypothetical protein [Terriglobia bacterium]
MTQLQEHLAELDACSEACRWAGDRTAAQAWTECERADWLLWWAAETERNSHQQIVVATAACARTVLQYVATDDRRPLLAIEAAERWAEEPSEWNRAAAEAAARDARAARDAAEAAAWAARAARDAAEAAAWAAAWAARAAARDAAEAAAWAAHQEMCRIIRSMLVCPFEEVA